MNSLDRQDQSVALTFFNDHEARAVEAVAERIIPGGDGDPGATDAGVVYYIDRAVAGFSTALQKVYRLGLRELESVCQSRFGRSFAELENGQQDDVVRRYLGPETGDGAATSKPPGEDDYDFEGRGTGPGKGRPLDSTLLERFFAVVREHAIEGMFCDPVYGGNRGAVGWRLVGFPGAHWGYTVEQMGENYDGRQIAIQTLSDLRKAIAADPDAFPSSNRRV